MNPAQAAENLRRRRLLLAWSVGGGGALLWLGAFSVPHGLPAWAAALSVGALGGSLGLAAWLGGPRLLRGSEDLLQEEITRLRAAEAMERQANTDLGKWMASAVQELRALSERVVQIQETERGRLARDLHDSVGQALTALQLDLELLRRELPAPAAQELLDRAHTACGDAMSDLRRVVYDLRPPELVEGAEVAGVLGSYAERFELRTGVPTSFRATGGAIRSTEIATCLLRVLQEALTNVSRHAAATEVGILLQVRPREVVLEVHDDGQGFEPAAPRTGTGLRGIQERCAFLGGTVSLQSRPTEGTRISIHLPVPGELTP